MGRLEHSNRLIVMAVDLNRSCQELVSKIEAVCLQSHSRLVLVHVLEPDFGSIADMREFVFNGGNPAFDSTAVYSSIEHSNLRKKHFLQVMKSLTKKIDPNVKVDYEVIEGSNVEDVIFEEGLRLKAWAVAIGSHGGDNSDFPEFYFSKVRRFLELATLPVIVIPSETEQMNSLESMQICDDLMSNAAVSLGFAMASLFNIKSIIHQTVLTTTHRKQGSVTKPELAEVTNFAGCEQELIRRSISQLKDNRNIDYIPIVSNGPIKEAIHEVTDRHQPDIVLYGGGSHWRWNPFKPAHVSHEFKVSENKMFIVSGDMNRLGK